MLRLAIFDDASFMISSVEQNIAGPGYTINVVRKLKKMYPKAQLRFMLGADNLEAFWNWHLPWEILKEINILAGARPGFKPDSASKFPAGSVEYIQTRMLGVSSSGIREMIKSGISQNELAELVPQPVAAYIFSRGLYR